MRLLTACLVLLLALSAFAEQRGRGDDDDSFSEEELKELIEKMREKEETLRDLSKQERSITRALGELDESISRMDAEAARLDAQAHRSEERVKTAELEAARLTRDLEEAEARLRRRLQSVLRLGPSADIQVLLGAHSLKDLMWRRHVMRKVAAADAELVKDVETRREELLRERESLIARRAEHAKARERLERTRAAAAQTRASRAQALHDVAMQKGATQRKLNALSAARRRLRDLLEDLPPPADATGFLSFKGRLPWPTSGEVTIPFGPREAGPDGVDTMHSGISIAAPLGQQVLAVGKGRVVHAGWLRGFGQLLIMDHGDGFHTLLAHLSRISVQTGDQVAAGDVVAYVGDSESLEGPRLYFELRQKGRPVDPFRWLTPR